MWYRMSECVRRLWRLHIVGESTGYGDVSALDMADGVGRKNLHANSN